MTVVPNTFLYSKKSLVKVSIFNDVVLFVFQHVYSPFVHFYCSLSPILPAVSVHTSPADALQHIQKQQQPTICLIDFSNDTNTDDASALIMQMITPNISVAGNYETPFQHPICLHLKFISMLHDRRF